MKQLSKLQSIVMLAGAFCMIVGAGLYVVGIQAVTPWVFAVGAVSFAVIQMQQTYAGRNITIKRLRRIMTFGDILFILSALLMLENTYRFILPLFTTYLQNGYYQYVTYINNNWVILLLIAAVIEIYTTHRISNELDKEAKKL